VDEEARAVGDRGRLLDLDAVFGEARPHRREVVDLEAKVLSGRLGGHRPVDEDVDLVTVATGAEPDEFLDGQAGGRTNLVHAEGAAVEAPGRLVTVCRHRNAGVLETQDRGHRYSSLVAVGSRSAIVIMANCRTGGAECPVRDE
jgi:hypothetical protein